MNEDLYSRRGSLPYQDKKQIITPTNSEDYGNFKLDPNWDSESEKQTIRLTFMLDEID